MLTKFQKVKESILITILNVLLPTVDILTDLISITKLYTGTETHIDCDERSEVITHLSDFDDDDNLISIQAWYEGRRKCLENSSSSESTFNSHPIWATSLLVPFLLSYLVTWFIWWSVDKSKTITWIAPLLSVYPQVIQQHFLINACILGASDKSHLPHLGQSERGSCQKEDFAKRCF